MQICHLGHKSHEHDDTSSFDALALESLNLTPSVATDKEKGTALIALPSLLACAFPRSKPKKEDKDVSAYLYKSLGLGGLVLFCNYPCTLVSAARNTFLESVRVRHIQLTIPVSRLLSDSEHTAL